MVKPNPLAKANLRKTGKALRYLNLESLERSPANVARIWRWVDEHPDCEVADIAKALDLTASYVNEQAKRLTEGGWMARAGAGNAANPYRYAARRLGEAEQRKAKSPWHAMREQLVGLSKRARDARMTGSLASMREALMLIERDTLSVRDQLYAQKFEEKE